MTTPLERLTNGYYNSNPVSGANPGGLDDDGHVANFPAALSDTAAVAVLAAGSAGQAEGYKDAAAASAQTALNAVVASGTSNSTIVNGAGSKVVALIETGLPFAKGQDVKLFRRSAPTTTAMWGTITDVVGQLVTVDVPAGNFLGAAGGSFSDWGLTTAGRPVAGTLSHALNWAPTVTMASAATVNIGAAASNMIDVTGTTTITAFDVIGAGAEREVRFTGALTLTHNETSLDLPGNLSIITAAGDVARFRSLGSGNWKCTSYLKANGDTLANTAVSAVQTAATTLTNSSSYYQQFQMTVRGIGVQLPAASTYPLTGPKFEIANLSDFDLPIRNNGGSIVAFARPGKVVKVIASDVSTANGQWLFSDHAIYGETALYVGPSIGAAQSSYVLEVHRLDADRDLLLIPVSSGGLKGIVHNRTTGAFGALTTINSLADVVVKSVMISSTTVLTVCSAAGGALFEARVLSITGTTITVNSAVTHTPANSIVYGPAELFALNGSYVMHWSDSAGNVQRVIALTVAGSVPTWGASVTTTNMSSSASNLRSVTVIGAGAIMTWPATSAILAVGITVTGTTVTIGTPITMVADNTGAYRVELLGTGRVMVVYQNSSVTYANLLTLTSATVTQVAPVSGGMNSGGPFSTKVQAQKVGSNKMVACVADASQNVLANIFTDTSGVLSAGTALVCCTPFSATFNQGLSLGVDGDVASFMKNGTSSGALAVVSLDCSGASPTLSRASILRSGQNNVYYNDLPASGDFMTDGETSPGDSSTITTSKGILVLPYGTPNSGDLLLLEPHPIRVKQDGPFLLGRYRGAAPAELWGLDLNPSISLVIRKLEGVA